jgi:hypothetical protein
LSRTTHLLVERYFRRPCSGCRSPTELSHVPSAGQAFLAFYDAAYRAITSFERNPASRPYNRFFVGEIPP